MVQALSFEQVETDFGENVACYICGFCSDARLALVDLRLSFGIGTGVNFFGVVGLL